MKSFFAYLLSFLIFFNQVSYSATIRSTTINKNKYLIKCVELKEFQKINDCFFEKIGKHNPAVVYYENKIKKKDLELQNLLFLTQIFNEAIKDNLISDKLAYQEWIKILDSKYSKKNKRLKLDETIAESKCLIKDEFEYFIDCFYKEFRNINAYKSANLLTKKRIEVIMINVMSLKDGGDVLLLDKLDTAEKIFEGSNDGFDFFQIMMSGIGTSFYKKKDVKSNIELDYKKIMLFIAISIILSLVAKKVLSKTLGGSGGKTIETKTTTLNPSSAGTKYGFSSPSTATIVQKPWFRYVYRYGFY